MMRTSIALLITLAARSALATAHIKPAPNNLNVQRLLKFSPRNINHEIDSNLHAMQAEINTKNPLFVALLLDRSESMSGPFHGSYPGDTKAEAIARHTNSFMRSLILRLVDLNDVEPVVKNYVHLAAIGYSGDAAENLLTSAPGAPSEDHTRPHPYITPIRSLATKALLGGSGEPAVGGTSIIPSELSSWITPHAYGNTPMGAALRIASDMTSAWTKQYPNAHQPIVINLTDGQSSDFGAVRYANKIRETATNHGASILMNANLSSSTKEAIKFPSDVNELSDDIVGSGFGHYARMLFNTASGLPPAWVKALLEQGYNVNDASRAMLFNANIDEIHEILEWGTRATLGR